MQILVTGGAGFIGTNLIKRLLVDGHNVESMDNYSTGKKDNEIDGCKYIETDVSDSIRRHGAFGLDSYRLTKPDIIYHLGALPRIQPSFINPTNTFDSNVKGTQNIMEYARKLNISVVYAGSSSSHGDKYANPYTHSKWLGEEVVTMYNKIYDIPTAICRFYNVYGEYQLTEGAYCTVLGIFERLYYNNQPLTITDDGEQRRDFTYVGDIVDGLMKCAKSLYMSETIGETFELGRGKNHSVNELASAFGDYPIKYIDKRPGEMRNTLNTDTKARDVLGWNPRGDVIDYIKNNILKK
jgi:UDP-glucose 4-epimerase|tara:strand:+ start:447 stop:1334 length:888 start_codon:yes stop_codon:yes gene_type:complete